MACRIGMSTEPEERIAYWMEKEGHTDSEILAYGPQCIILPPPPHHFG